MRLFIFSLIIILQCFLFNVFASAKDDTSVVKNNHNIVELDLTSAEKSDSGQVENGSVVADDTLEYEKSMDLKKKEHNILLYDDVNHMQEKEKNVSKTLKKDVGKNAQIGASYNAGASSGEYDDSVSVFTKYEKGRAGITSSYSQSRKGYNSGEQGSVSIAPELNLNKHISLKNVYSDNLSTNVIKNEVVLSVKPFKDGRTNINLGAGQVYSEDNQPARSQLNFSTNFRF